MKNAILLHGLPSKEEYYDESEPSMSNAHWFPWLQNQLLIRDIKADTPEVFKAYKMEWNDWVKEVERFEIGSETILVGHSMGGGFWIRYLSEHPKLQVAKAVLVAPWLNFSHEEDTDFFEFKLNSNITNQAKQLTVFASDNDSKDVKDSVDFLKRKLSNANFKEFHNYGHFCYRDMKTDKFPELLEECLKNND
jgi:predicted alpha/beta hydrolase family esterase